MGHPASGQFDRAAARLGDLFPLGPRLGVIGSTSFWHAESNRTCMEIGGLLATIPGLVLITGGVEGIGEAVGRSFFRACSKAGRNPQVFHVLPEGEKIWDYGQTHFAGSHMGERREILARLAQVYLEVEGGPGTAHESRVALARGATVLPVGRSGGHARELYRQIECPSVVDAQTWNVLGSSESTPEAAAMAAFCAIKVCLRIGI